MGMLYQIERRLAALKEKKKMREEDVAVIKTSESKVPGSKVVAINVDPKLYAQLQEAAKKHGVRGIRGALMLAAKTGLRHLL